METGDTCDAKDADVATEEKTSDSDAKSDDLETGDTSDAKEADVATGGEISAADVDTQVATNNEVSPSGNLSKLE
jgi:hypothetical protein